MRYRKEDRNGDSVWGRGSADYHHDSVEAVAQAIRSRLLLFRGEWFVDTSAGMPWGGFPTQRNGPDVGEVLGRPDAPSRDLAIQMRVLDTQGVLSLVNYASDVDPNTRRYVVSASVNTIYGRIEIEIPSQSPTAPAFALSYSPLGGGAPA